MCEINNQYSNRTADINWPRDMSMERQQQHDRIVFENVADQYVKGEDVTAFFSILHGIEVHPNEDQIGLLRIGCTNIKNCVAYAPVKFHPSKTSGSIRHGTATFSSSSLLATNDEFYQFCYINKKTTNLGSSIPFQLNCALDDIDYLFNASIGKINSLIAFDDNDDMVVIDTKHMLTEGKFRSENRQLSNIQHPFESQQKTQVSSPQQSECISSAHAKLIDESKQLRSQLAVTVQLTKDQATQIVDLERRLIQANELSRKSNQRQIFLEQQLRDFKLTSEKHQRSLQGQVNQSLNPRQIQLEQQLRDFKLTSEKHQRSMQGQLNAYTKQAIQREDQINILETMNNLSREELNGKNPDEQAYMILKTSFNAIEKRCVKHQKSEIDLKRQLIIYQKFVNDLQHEVQHLTKRLSTSTEQYDTLFCKYNAVECKNQS